MQLASSSLPRFSILAAVVLASIATYAQATQAADYVFGYQTGIDPTKVAQANGDYEKAIGAQLDWRRFNNGPEVIAALASNSIQMGNIGSSPLAAATSRGLPLVTFLVSAELGSSEALVVRDGSGIERPEQLVGKTIATPFVSTSHYSLLAALKHWGVDADQVHIVNLQPAEIAAAWKRGDIDGAYVWSPALGEIEKSGKVLADSTEVGKWGAPTFEVWAARKDFAAAHPEVLEQFARVSLAAFGDYYRDPSAWSANSKQVAAIARLTGASAADIPTLLEGSHYPDLDEQLSPALLGGGTAEAIKHTAGFLLEQKRIPRVLDDYSPYVDADYIEALARPATTAR